MIVGVLIVVWVVVLRVMYQKKVMEDRQKAGFVTPGPASLDTLKRQLGEVSDRFRGHHDNQREAS